MRFSAEMLEDQRAGFVDPLCGALAPTCGLCGGWFFAGRRGFSCLFFGAASRVVRHSLGFLACAFQNDSTAPRASHSVSSDLLKMWRNIIGPSSSATASSSSSTVGKIPSSIPRRIKTFNPLRSRSITLARHARPNSSFRAEYAIKCGIRRFFISSVRPEAS